MKYLLRYTPLLILGLIFGSCQKYLDIKSSGAQKFIETTTDCQQMLDNYSLINGNYPSDLQASSDDYYLGSNTFPANINSQEDQDMYTWKNYAIRLGAAPQWQNPYNVVYNVNLVLEALDRIKGQSDAVTWNNLKGSALFLRSYVFWNIAQQYAKPYGVATLQEPGIPIRLTPDLNEAISRGTVKQTYDIITANLEEAVGLLNTTSSIASRPNKASAYAMLARVYLSMEEYGKALTNADASLQLKKDLIDYNSLDQSSGAPIARFNTEVLFNTTISPSDLLNPGNETDQKARINDELYSSYAQDDLRKVIFFKPNKFSINLHNPAHDTNPDQPETVNISFPDGSYRFTGNYDEDGSSKLFNGLAVDEMYLTRAECYARTGNINGAMTDLKTLLDKRWKGGVAPAMNAASVDDAISKVLDERRKELVMRSQRWTDLRRLNKDPKYKKDLIRELKEFTPVVTGTYPNLVTNSKITVKQSWTLPANDPRYTLLIPQQVINAGNVPQNIR